MTDANLTGHEEVPLLINSRCPEVPPRDPVPHRKYTVINLFAPDLMQTPVKERIAKLRDEIAQIREAERLYLQGGKNKLDAVGDHARRLQRLQEILEQLNALTDWRKL